MKKEVAKSDNFGFFGAVTRPRHHDGGQKTRNNSSTSERKGETRPDPSLDLHKQFDNSMSLTATELREHPGASEDATTVVPHASAA